MEAVENRMHSRSDITELLLESRENKKLWIVGRGLISNSLLDYLSITTPSKADECRLEALLDIYRKTRAKIDTDENIEIFKKLYSHGLMDKVVYLDIDAIVSDIVDPNIVIEVYGSITRFRCKSCGWRASIEYVSENGCICKKCGGELEPDIYLHRHSLPRKILSELIFELTTADVVFVIFLTTDLTVFELLLIALASHLAQVIVIEQNPPGYLCELVKCIAVSFREVAEAILASKGDA